MADPIVVKEWLDKDQCELLNISYIDTRYPVHWPTNYSKEKSLKVQEAANSIASAITKLLKP